MRVRKATVDDLNDLLGLGRVLALHEQKCDPLLVNFNEWKSRKRYTKELKNKNAAFFVAETEGLVVGYIFGYMLKSPAHLKDYDKIGYLEACVVLKRFRRKGISKRLTKALLGWFKEHDIELVELGVYASNKAKKVWKKVGFSDFHITMRKFL